MRKQSYFRRLEARIMPEKMPLLLALAAYTVLILALGALAGILVGFLFGAAAVLAS